MVRRALVLTAVLLLVTLAAASGAPQTQAQVKDHPLVSRFQGSDVQDYKVSDFDSFVLPLGPALDKDKFGKMQPLEGKVTKFKYSIPAGKSGLEIARSYQSELQRAGFQTLYSCDGKACFGPKYPLGYDTMSSGLWCFSCADAMHFVAAKLSRPTGDAYVTVAVNTDQYEGGTWLSIVEPKPMATGTVTVNAAAMVGEISTTGHATIYGILFDTGQATIKPASDATLVEIGKLLAANPQLKLHVVGHTDNVGTLASNMTLSKQRADAVVNTLVTKYQVAASRLQASGVGPLAPVASNKTDDGRARNRRVELVEQ